MNCKIKQKPTHLHYVFAGLLLLIGFFCMLNKEIYAYEADAQDGRGVLLGFLKGGVYALDVTVPETEADEVLVMSREINENNEAGILLASLNVEGTEGMLHTEFVVPSDGLHEIWVTDEGFEDCASKVSFAHVQSIRLANYDNYFYGLLFIMAAVIVMLLALYVPFEKYKIPLLLFVMGLVSGYPNFMDGLLTNPDVHIHLTRLEGIYNGIRAGEFPVYLNTVQMAGFGNASAAMYPSAYLYPFAFLRFANVSLLTSFRLMLISLGIVTAFTSYYAYRGITKSTKIGLIATFLYVFSIYRTTNVLNRGALGEATAMIFLPLVIYGMYEVLYGNRKRWYILAIGMSGVVLSHVLTTEMMIPLLVLEVVLWMVSLVRAKETKRILPGIWAGVKAAFVTCLIALHFLIPFFTFFSLDLQANHGDKNVASTPIHLSQMFTVFCNYSVGQVARETTQNEMPLTVGGLLLIGVVLLFVWGTKNNNMRYKIGKRTTLHAIVSLLLASVFFPWNIAMKSNLVSTLLMAVQFIWRYLELATVLLCLAAAIGIYEFSKEKEYGKLLVWLVLAANFISFAFYGDEMVHVVSQFSDKMAVEGEDTHDALYMLWDGEFHGFWYERSAANLYLKEGTSISVSNYLRRGTTVSAHVVADLSEEETLIIPLNWYPGFSAWINGEKRECALDGYLASVKVSEPEFNLLVKYTGLTSFHIANWISLIAVLGLIVYILLTKKHLGESDENEV